ncbi:MAG: aromatic ring-hydroxylating dioxygenase subunit alpha [Acidimicrobiales bacterium]
MADDLDPTNEDWWAGTRRAVFEATGLDPLAYASAEFFELEKQRVFERAWVCVGIADDVSEPGRLIARTIGNRSIIITRGSDGELRGFYNSCRHRGTELVESDCDIVNTIRCPYHRWGYGVDGTLQSTPLFEDVPRADFDKADFGLIPVRVATWGVLLFACLDSETPLLDDWLGDLPDRMAGYQLDQWHKRAEQTVDIDANWKLISENYQEYYHLPWVHPELAKVSRVVDHYRYQGAGMYCGQSTTPISGDDRNDWLTLPPAAGLDDSDAVSGRFVAIFPNVLLSVLPNHAWVMRFDPASPGHTVETCTLLLPPSTGEVSDADIEPTVSFWLDINAEDIDIVQRGQRGLARGSVPPGPLAPRFEEPLHRFQNILSQCFILDSLAAITIPAGDRSGEEDDRFGTVANPSPAAIDI